MPLIASLLLAVQALPETLQDEWRVGARLNVSTSFGEPANDIIGGNLAVSRRVHERVWLTLEAYAGVFDFENPGDAVLGTSGTPTADAKIRMQTLTLAVEWHPFEASWLDPYLAVGLGAVFLGDGEAQRLPQVDVDVNGSAGFTAHVGVGASANVVGPIWLNAEFRVAGIFAEMEVRDAVTGLEDDLSSWEAVGFLVGLEIRF